MTNNLEIMKKYFLVYENILVEKGTYCFEIGFEEKRTKNRIKIVGLESKMPTEVSTEYEFDEKGGSIFTKLDLACIEYWHVYHNVYENDFDQEFINQIERKIQMKCKNLEGNADDIKLLKIYIAILGMQEF